MPAYKIKSRIDNKGNKTMYNLPYENRESVGVVLLIKDGESLKDTTAQRFDRVKASFGTINSIVQLPDDI